MDQASASPEASCAHNPVAPRTSSSCSRSVDRSRTGGPPHARSGPQCEPHAAPSNTDSRPSSPAPCRLKAKGYLLPEFYSGATGRSGRFNEGLLLRRLHLQHPVFLGVDFVWTIEAVITSQPFHRRRGREHAIGLTRRLEAR